MRPAYSVILFTTLSGAGYGLLAVLGAMLLLGTPPAASAGRADRWACPWPRWA